MSDSLPAPCAGRFYAAWHAQVDTLPTPLLPLCQRIFPSIPLQTSDATEKDNLLRALTFATDPQVIQQTLQLALDPVVRPQDMGTVVVGVAARGGDSLQQSWAFFQRWGCTAVCSNGGTGFSLHSFVHGLVGTEEQAVRGPLL